VVPGGSPRCGGQSDVSAKHVPQAPHLALWRTAGTQHLGRPAIFLGVCDRPPAASEDNGRKDHGDRDEDPRFADPHRRSGACTRWIERDLNDAVPGRVKRDRRPNTTGLQS
jgi:hypothetical protein